MSENKREYERIVNEIINEIKVGRLSVGDRIPSERALAEEYSTSRNSTREALKILDELGVVESRQGSGNYISANVEDSLSLILDVMLCLKRFDRNELFRFRMSMEKVVFSVLIEKTSRLQQIADRVDAILNEPVSGDDEEEDQDSRFHAALLEETENRLLILMMRAASGIFKDMIHSIRSVSDAKLKESLLKVHKNMVIALRSGDREKCEKAVELHYKLVDKIAKKAMLEEYLENREYKQVDNSDIDKTKDRLTGLYNKSVFFEKVEDYIAKHPDEDLMLWSADIQGLRFVNEQYGMEAGDQLICAVGTRGKGTKGYIFGGRIGGDKFCTLVKDDHSDVNEINQALIEEYDKKLPVPGVSVKNGIYHIDKNENLSAHAMYVKSVLALQSIKNSYSTMIAEYNDAMRNEMLNSKQIEIDAKESLQKGEFMVYLQPKINLAKNEVAGAEALVRWVHPELGFISPGVFIPIFEKNGFVKELDYWIWEEVCKLLVRWQEQGFSVVPVSINVSRNSFQEENLAETIINLADKYNLDHSLLEIEVTEYSCLDNIELIQNTIKKLHDAGFTISLDDFGTGYSSMVVLSKLDIDIMKLDMSLIQNDDKDSKRSALEFALQLAEMMKLRTVAEGIETASQVERIRSLGGDYIQGYFYSKPLKQDAFEEYVRGYGKSL